MKEKQNSNLKNSLFSLSMILSIIGVRLVDQYIYEMSIWLGLIVVVLLTTVLNKLIDSIPKLDKEITPKTKITLNISSLAVICILFYTFTL
ncbi:hypothetical protein [Psychrobacillus sp. NPDC093180]|uniref:hypothetical protein n=1 Tax=Psychrobacillus sp. NPDC093180 TaxID=3364489 RepID=UPI003818F55F